VALLSLLGLLVLLHAVKAQYSSGDEEQVVELDEEWEKRGSMKRSRRQATGGISILPRKSRDETATKIFSTLTDGCGYSFVAALLVRTVF